MSFLQRFLNFDRLIGPVLVKLVYYFGAVVIAIGAIGALLTAIFALFGGDFGQGLTMLLAVPAVAAVAFVYWRFVCELFMLAFLGYERLGQVRDLMRIAAGQTPPAETDPEHPSF